MRALESAGVEERSGGWSAPLVVIRMSPQVSHKSVAGERSQNSHKNSENQSKINRKSHLHDLRLQNPCDHRISL